ncbi:MAG: hypothetical protein KDA21_03580 [Phycisphaerales bacterium]|nr:hypothetical protein [Phycisphaerales bacterium]
MKTNNATSTTARCACAVRCAAIMGSITLAAVATAQPINAGTTTTTGNLTVTIGEPIIGTVCGTAICLEVGPVAAVPLPCPGDVNGDRRVDFSDLEILLDRWGTTGIGGMTGDLNSDGNVNFADLNILLDRWGTSCG